MCFAMAVFKPRSHESVHYSIMFVLYFYSFYIIGIDLPDVRIVHCEVIKELFLLHLPHQGISRLLIVIQSIILLFIHVIVIIVIVLIIAHYILSKPLAKKVSVGNKGHTGDNYPRNIHSKILKRSA